MKVIHAIAFILLVVGGLNWLLVGLNLDWNLVDAIFGVGSVVSKIVYILVGLSAILLVITHKKDCKHCTSPSPAGSTM